MTRWQCSVPGCTRGVPYTDWPVCEHHHKQTRTMRPLHEIAQDVHACATAWEPEARLIGNVRADEIAYLAAYAMPSQESE